MCIQKWKLKSNKNLFSALSCFKAKMFHIPTTLWQHAWTLFCFPSPPPAPTGCWLVNFGFRDSGVEEEVEEEGGGGGGGKYARHFI